MVSKNLSVCLSVTNFNLNYLRTGVMESAEIFFRIFHLYLICIRLLNFLWGILRALAEWFNFCNIWVTQHVNFYNLVKLCKPYYTKWQGGDINTQRSQNNCCWLKNLFLMITCLNLFSSNTILKYHISNFNKES